MLASSMIVDPRMPSWSGTIANHALLEPIMTSCSKHAARALLVQTSAIMAHNGQGPMDRDHRKQRQRMPLKLSALIASGAGTEGRAQFYFICVQFSGPFFMQQNEPFRLKTCTPVKATP